MPIMLSLDKSNKSIRFINMEFLGKIWKEK